VKILKKPELLAPAGSLETLVTAVAYGADAVYVGGQSFSLRAGAKNFTTQELKTAAKLCRNNGVRLYVALNTVPRNDEIDRMPEYIESLSYAGVDAVIVTDPGVLNLVKKLAPRLDIHVSTQANTMNYASCRAWHDMGAKRIILARELSLPEIAEIREKTPKELELEVFVHGAMCISHSGRCLLSNYLTGRDANRGDCAHPCRWKYYLMEEKHPGEFFRVFEDETGTHIMNSKDLCLIEYLPELYNAGVTSFKIEGRAKSNYYVASVVWAYRDALDKWMADPSNRDFAREGLEELEKVSHRPYTTGFLKSPPSQGQHYADSSYIRKWELLAVVLDYDHENEEAICSVRNQVHQGDSAEFLIPRKGALPIILLGLKDEQGEPISEALHPEMVFRIPCKTPIPPQSMLRRKIQG